MVSTAHCADMLCACCFRGCSRRTCTCAACSNNSRSPQHSPCTCCTHDVYAAAVLFSRLQQAHMCAHCMQQQQSSARPCTIALPTISSPQLLCPAGCFPGQGVYGPVSQSPDVCEECPGGTYSQGGALAPCQPCSPNAFDYLTSAPGSRSIADCVCAAGGPLT